MILIDGPRIPPKSGTAKKLVILFHGYGSNGADLAGLAQAWAPHFPDVAWASPDAPEPVPGAPGGYQWFPISRLDPEAMESGVRSAYPTAEQFVKSELNRWNLTPADLVLVGFSPGHDDGAAYRASPRDRASRHSWLFRRPARPGTPEGGDGLQAAHPAHSR